MPTLPPLNNEWLIEGHITAPVARTGSLTRGPQHLQQLNSITLHESDLVTVEREVADAFHDYLVFTTTDRADRIYVDARPQSDALSVTINTERFIVVLAGLNQFVVFRTLGGNDMIHIADEVTRPILVDAGEGDDDIRSGGGYSRIFAGPGNDAILTRRGASYIEAGEGADQVIALGDGDMTVYAGPGNDRVVAGRGMAFINGGGDDDHLTGASAQTILVGGPGNDALQAGSGPTVLYTGDGLDVATQLKPDDKVFANPGSGISAAGHFIAHGLTSADTLPACAPSRTQVTDVSPISLDHTGVRVIGSPQFQQRVNDDLQQLAGSPNGKKMFEALYAAELRSGTPINIYELQDETNGMFAPSNPPMPPSTTQGDMAGTPVYGGAVYYNPSYIGNRMSNVPLFYHELCHAYNAVTGSRLPGESEDGEDGNKPRPMIANIELQAVGLPTQAMPFDFDHDPSTPPTNTNPAEFTENGIREELGMPLRKQYSSPPI
ncbi:M91 family zinc metallopeptidase [Pseudomonas reactans]|uniref:M91 family zinc metallopeptidase n=1 Tax=Pseudomonas reactans TaxID=117680 RepID=UPI00159F7C64|nr:M91 family zinc metallopeptidase [Pseudomonas reactans]NWA69122.1 hypothetical protein [Pseudomonas reactans]